MLRRKRTRTTDLGSQSFQGLSVQDEEGGDWVMAMSSGDTRRRARSNAFSDDQPNEREDVKKKEWMMEKNVFEEQLENLNLQLVTALTENQELKIMLEEKKKSGNGQSLRREVDRLKKEKKELEEKMEKERKAHRRVASSPGARRAGVQGSTEYGVFQGSNLATATTGEGFERVSVHNIAPVKQSPRIGSWNWTRNLMLDFLSDFTDECHTSSDDQQEPAPTLQPKRLKANITRLVSASKPWKELAKGSLNILHWTNVSRSLLIFLIYMYSVWNGWIIQLLLLVAIIRLTLNYLYIIGIAEHFGFQPPKWTVDENEFASLGISDKYHLVKEVGQMVQNHSGAVADHLEKAQNLLLWHHPQSTRKVYSFLWVAFLVSIFVPNNYTLTIVGLFIGFKLFIVDNVYARYPKVKAKYDTVAQMWDSLPTNAELLQRQGLTEEEEMLGRSHSSPDSADVVSIASSPSSTDVTFCERFQIPSDELPFDNWHTGKRCSLLDIEKPLRGSKNGKIFLTYSYLCFEKSSKAVDAADRFTIQLSAVTRVAKAKPLSVLPGSGMAIEIHVGSRDKPVTFGAILQRDAVFEDICNQGLVLGLPWGSACEEARASAPLEPETSEASTAAPQASIDESVLPTEANTS